MARGLVTADPGNTKWQRNVSVLLEKIGDVRLAAGDRAGALQAYEESLVIARRLVAADPGNTEWASDIAGTCRDTLLGSQGTNPLSRESAAGSVQATLEFRRPLASPPASANSRGL